MQNDLDRYEVFYADRLWNLLPEIYRIGDTGDDSTRGPLRELCERIGAQIAVVRRSIDRLWDDQSIESCDDWVVPYIGDLLGTNLVSGLDARGRRLDVANTIYYRRRKGTVTILEQVAGDVTGWDVRVVELFRRMHRTRHGLDPEIGTADGGLAPAELRELQLASGLVGRFSGTVIGGTPHLRSVYGASKSGTAFDEFFYTPDVRRGEEKRGWYNIPRLGVFVWRLHSFPETAADPALLLCDAVRAKAPCQNHFSFDPTGREIPLFASASRTTDRERFGASWVSPAEWELPGPIAKPLLDDDRRAFIQDPSDQEEPKPSKAHPDLYFTAGGDTLDPRSVGVFLPEDTKHTVIPLDKKLRIWPEIGRFAIANNVLKPLAWYHYGFSARIGAGAYDRRPLGQPAATPGVGKFVGGGGAVGAIAPTSTVTLSDSRTYTSVPIVSVTDLTIRSANGRRPLIRPATFGEWKLTGATGSDNKLRLEGIFVSGTDIVLSGTFAEVSISFSTLDPGEADPAATTAFAKAIDGRELRPTTLWIEGSITSLTIDRSITGPIRTRLDGNVTTLTIRDSIVQSLPGSASATITPQDIKDPGSFAALLKARRDPASAAISKVLTTKTRNMLNLFRPQTRPSATLIAGIAGDLNAALPQPQLFTGVAAARGATADVAEQNRALLSETFPLELADLALAFRSGEVRLERTTVLGPMQVHRIDASESILNDVAVVANAQEGCVRFSAWSTGSVLPRKYESVEIAPNASLFTSRSFANPAYAQLRSDVDSLIVPAAAAAGEIVPDSIRAGAENGSEMGAFHGELSSIKERSLQIKFEEFMPVGLVPVIVHVT